MAKDAGGDAKMAARGDSKAGPNDRPMAPGDRPGIGAPGDNPRGTGDDPAARPGIGAGGRDGGAAGRDGGGTGQKPPAGSWKYAVLTFSEKIAAGEDSGYEKLINSKAKGLLAEIRDGELDPDKLEDLKKSFAEATPLMQSIKNTGTTIEIKLKGKLGHIITVTTAKEGKEFKVRDLKITEPADK